MKKIISLALIMALFACSSPEYIKLDQESAYEQLQSEEITLVDVRELSEYNEGHIEGALLIPLGTIDENVDSLLPDKDAKIFVYCRSGNRSRTAANTLIELGYTNVFDIGGITTWKYEIVK